MDNPFARLQDQIDAKLLHARRVFLWGAVDDDSAQHVVQRLMYLDLEDPKKEIQLVINSPGGYVTAGMAIYDTMMGLKSPVSTVCAGLAASMGSILLSAGAKGRRFTMPHARVMIHQPSGGAGGQASDIAIQAAEIVKTRQLSAEILAKNCGRTAEQVLADFDRDFWMNDKESVEYGIVDGVMDKL